MKRELKARKTPFPIATYSLIARPIPMKRELKGKTADAGVSERTHRKAHPDEKGTESHEPSIARRVQFHRKAHPDEKGTESVLHLAGHLI